MFDFENRFNPGGSFFPDVDGRFKFSTIVFGGVRREFRETRCAFFLHRTDELDEQSRVLALTAEDFALVNPNTGAAPIFRTRRDADITRASYGNNVLLVAQRAAGPEKVWPISFAQGMFNMTADSKQFKTRAELEKLGFTATANGRWSKAGQVMLPLYEGKMVQMYDHRAADVVVNSANMMCWQACGALHRAA